VVRVDGSGFAGEGDALVTARPGLALSVITADCVPALISMGDAIAAVHAGWRGLAGGIVEEALGTMHRTWGTLAADVVAWIGPAIGACCYEVGADVAAQVVAASGEEVATPGPAGKPHLDMALAVELQLRRAGIADVRRLGPCTRCEPELLWSYRREGAKAGRNIAYVWMRERSA
jgi:YfiH family protein